MSDIDPVKFGQMCKAVKNIKECIVCDDIKLMLSLHPPTRQAALRQPPAANDATKWQVKVRAWK